MTSLYSATDLGQACHEYDATIGPAFDEYRWECAAAWDAYTAAMESANAKLDVVRRRAGLILDQVLGRIG